MGEAAGPLSVSNSEDLAGGSLLILSLELAEDLGAFGHVICSAMGGKVPVLDLDKGRGLFPFYHFPIRCGLLLQDQGWFCCAKSSGDDVGGW